MPTHRQRLIVDKKIISNNNITLKTRLLQKRLSLNSYENILKVLEKRATPVIPLEYREFSKLFKEELGIEALPKH
jgi:hypothetical protein